MTTELHAVTAGERPASAARACSRARAGADGITVALFSVAAFLIVLALLAGGVAAPARVAARPTVLVRKVYRTTIVETVIGASGPTGISVSQSVASSGSAAAPAAPVATRSSGLR